MRGMDISSGKEIKGIEHLKQSIRDILTTPIGTRVMLRDYGSEIFAMIDRPVNEDFAVDIYAKTAAALAKWEHRFKLEKVMLISVKQGKVELSLKGIYLPEGKEITLDGMVI